MIVLDEANLFSNARSQADLAQRFTAVIEDAAAQEGEAILFINNIKGFVQEASLRNVLWEAISEGDVRLIAGSSASVYGELSASYPELNEAFEVIEIASASPASDSGNGSASENEYRGDNVSADLRDMIASQPANKRINAILQAKDADSPVLRGTFERHGILVQDRIGTSDTLVVDLPLGSLEDLSKSGLINYVSPDRKTARTGHIEDTIGATGSRLQQIGGQSMNLTGTGVGIAVVDSGIYAGHEGWLNANGQSRVKANVDFTGDGTGDSYGHGTHVAGLAAGNSAKNNGAYRGVAPNANIISVKVLNNNGVGQTSWLLNGLNWILQNRTQHNIRVVNLSLGTVAVDTYTNDPIGLKVKELVNNGIVVVAAAGNLGRAPVGGKLYGTIHSPGNSPWVITVGASNSYGTTERSDDRVTTYSSAARPAASIQIPRPAFSIT